jgi:ABC-type polysaccharide/polyol phosphate transport system ATPase subunit
VSEPRIEVRQLTKEFRVASARPPSLFNQLRAALWLGHQTRRLCALSDVTFRLAEGESLGLVGHNGAGKSTLLRILSGIYRPTSGSCVIRGRITPVLELGAGMHYDLSVRENVFLYGSMIGFRREPLRARFDEIIAFAGLEDFVDARVKELSTGMRQRLTFAITAQLDSDLLLLDEILAVGDRAFREKSWEVFRRRRRAGKTLVLASHDLDAVAELCERALLLDHGTQRAFGPTAEILALYTGGAAPRAAGQA